MNLFILANTDTRFPGVYVQLVDTSFGIPSSGVSTAFIAFISEKGRDNQLVSIGSTEELLSTFGSIDSGKYGQGMLVLSNWFTAASSAYCIRVMPDTTNVPAMTYTYAGIYGKYSNSAMTMLEAGYANLCIVVNSANALELRHIAPKYYGSIKALNVQNQSAIIENVEVGNRYSISYVGKNTAGADDAASDKLSGDAGTGKYQKSEWVGKDGKIATARRIVATNQSGKPTKVDWSYEDLDTIGYCKAYNRNYYLVSYTKKLSTTSAAWEQIEPEFDRFDAVTVADILNAPPIIDRNNGESYEYGVSYLVASPSLKEFAGHYGQVATYTGIANGDISTNSRDVPHWEGWEFSTPNRVIVENDGYVIYDEPKNFEVTPENYQSLGLSTPEYNGSAVDALPISTFKNISFFISNDVKPNNSWSEHAGQIARLVDDNKSSTGYSWSFYTPYASSEGYDTYVNETIVMARTNYTTSSIGIYFNYYCYRRKPNYAVVQYWTRNPDVLFPAYLKRTSNIDAILADSRPDAASESNAGEYLFIFYAVGRGSYYNNIQMSLSLSTKSELEENDYDRTMILDIYDTNSGSKVLMESFEVSFNPDARDAVNDTSIFICNVLENYSKILRCKSVDRAYLTNEYSYMNNINTSLDTIFKEYERYNVVGTTKLSPALAGGYDGNLYNGNGTVNWTVAKNLLAKAYTGLLVNPNSVDDSDYYLTDVLDTEMVLIDVVLDAGYPKEVKVAINDMITARSNDCIGIIDQLDNASSEMAYRARTDANGITKGFNTPYIAIYEPYSEIYDKYTGNNIWVTPIYHAARAFAITDRDYGRHYAPAGVNRGLCTGINKLRYNLYKDNSYKEKFVTYCINPIICNRLGYVIYGQSTSYLKQTKLQDINIIRTIIEIERDLKLQLGTILFDLNDSNTLMTIDSAVRAYLGNKMANDVIEGYDCKVYATDYDITQHRARVDLVITPKSVLYQIFLTISV